MKKIMLTAVAVMAFAFSNAQETRFGVKAGANLSNFSGDVEDAKSLIGFQVGGFAEFKLSDKFAIQPELLFSTQGAKSEESEFGYSSEYKTHLSYINVPVMAKYYIVEKFSVEAGPQIGFLVSAKEKWETSGPGVSESGDEDAKDFYESINFGVNFGAGYDFTENLSVGLRYNLGLSNIAKTEDGADFKINNNVFSLSVGYKF
ncbi:porin family protein [Flavobacterium gelatinilyticum]|uniref:porin family protein n=1 Tax=Flavobacterium gelatinilyticum TaxID=3003260 RepID=UPI00247FC510|nr:porin family protein [Flavobacterium gelatinilyticum]